MQSLLKGLRTLLYWFSVVAMAIMLAVTFFSVISRYIFSFTFEWAEELSRFLFVWSVFLGSALIMGENGHLAVEFLPNILKGKIAGLFVELFIKVCSYIFIFILLTQGFKMTKMMMFQTSPGMGIPMGIIYSVIPLSSILMILYTIQDSIAFIRKVINRGAKNGKEA